MRLVLIILLFAFAKPAWAQEEACATLDGAAIVNDDGEYLGLIADGFDRDSIFNEYGAHGSEYRTGSIWNEYGKNGSEYRTNTAFNAYASRPPRLIKNKKVIGFLTVNKSIAGGVNPRVLGILCYDFKPPH
jgi:hypothetical protein